MAKVEPQNISTQNESSTFYYSNSQPAVIIQPQSQSLRRKLKEPPKWGIILTVNIFGMLLCCCILGFIGIICVIVGKSKSESKYLHWSHLLGIASISIGIVQWICLVFAMLFYGIITAYDITKFFEKF